MLLLLALLAPLVLSQESPNADKIIGSCLIIIDFTLNDKYALDPDCEVGDDCKNNAKHDFFLEVWINDANVKDSAKKRTTVKYNTAKPIWDETFCWQDKLQTAFFTLYEDDTYMGEDADYFVNPLGSQDIVSKRRSKRDLTLAILDGESKNVGMLRYSIEVNNNQWGLIAGKGCTVDSMLIEVTEPGFFKPLRGGWMNGVTKKFMDDDTPVILKRYQVTGEDVEKCGSQWEEGELLRAVALIHYTPKCAPETVVNNAEKAGAVGVIFRVANREQEQLMEVMRKQAVEKGNENIPARWITVAEGVDIDRTYDEHKIEKIMVKTVCPWEYEEDFSKGGMCIQDTWFQGKYDILKAKDEDGNYKPVVINDHAVFVPSDDTGVPVYIVNQKSRSINGIGEYRWMVTTSLSGARTIAECVTGTIAGETMEMNECEHWKIYDQQFGAWTDVLYSIMDFCPAEREGDLDACSHTQNEFAVTSAGGNKAIERNYWSVIALFGPKRYETGKDEEIVYLSGENFEGCDEYGDETKDAYGETANVRGKIVMVSRGRCYFTVKQVNAEAAGAIGVIVVNYEGSTNIYMAHSGTKAPGSIPIRLMQFDDGKKIKDAFQQLGGEKMRGGFICPKDFESPPAALCVTEITAYVKLGYYNNFHGTFRRMAEDTNDHPTYRLDPLTNGGDHSGQKWGTRSTGPKGEIDHTHTWLYYDAGGVDDYGNAWKIGPELNGGLDHIYAFCQGVLGGDNSSPDKCERSTGQNNEQATWYTYLVNNDSFGALNKGDILDDEGNVIGQRKMIFPGQCSWDMASEERWHARDEFDGIFCTKHNQCQPNQYCMSCKICLEMYDDGEIFQKDKLKHPCGMCMYERDVKNVADDGQCMPNVECIEEDGKLDCKNRCAIEEMGMDGNCPDFPGCDKSCPNEVGINDDSIWGDGNCDKKCAGCPAWQTEEVYDGGDCKDSKSLILENMEFEFQGKETSINMDCKKHYQNKELWTIQNVFNAYVTKVEGSKFEMTVTYEQKVAQDQFKEDKPIKLKFIGIEESLTEWSAEVVEVDEKSALKIFAMTGEIRYDEEKYASDVNPEGMYLIFLVEAGEDGWVCDSFAIPLSGDGTGGGGGDDGGDSKDMAKCKENEKKKKCDKSDSCGWFSNAKAVKSKFCQLPENKKNKKCTKQKNGACLHQPAADDDAPEKGQCILNDAEIYIKGKAFTDKFQGDEAAGLQPCDCTDWCLINYGQEGDEGRFVAMQLRKEVNNKGKVVAFCDCFYDVQKVTSQPDKKGNSVRAGDIVPGFLSNFDVNE